MDRFELIREVGEELISEENLKDLLEKKENPIAYDGFEPSGTSIHIAQGILRAINVNKMTKAGCKFKMLVADWHGWANNKMGGDLDKIQKVGKFYVEVWKACGMDLKNVEFIWASDLVKDDNYWKIVMQVARSSTVKRILRCSQIMGRSEDDSLSAAQILYPCMQTADIFYLKADICQLGLDQRKVNVLAREVGPKLGYYKPVIVSHHMLAGLQTPTPKLEEIESLKDALKDGVFESVPSLFASLHQKVKSYYPGLSKQFESLESSFAKLEKGEKKTKDVKNEFFNVSGKYFEKRQLSLKMSKSKPNTSIFMTDDDAQIKKKIVKAYCPEGEVDENPILEYCRYIIFEKYDSLDILRPEKWGGNLSFKSYEDLESRYANGEVHPADLKGAVAEKICELVRPVREHILNDPKIKKMYEEIRKFEVTR